MTDKELEEKRADAKRRWELFKQHKRESQERLKVINKAFKAMIDQQVELALKAKQA